MVVCLTGKITIKESDTGREYQLSPRRRKRIRPRVDIVKVPKGSSAKVIHGSKFSKFVSTRPIRHFNLLDTTGPNTDENDEYFIVGGEGGPEIIPDVGGPVNQVDFYYASEAYIEVEPPSGSEDDSVIITG